MSNMNQSDYKRFMGIVRGYGNFDSNRLLNASQGPEKEHRMLMKRLVLDFEEKHGSPNGIMLDGNHWDDRADYIQLLFSPD